MSKSLLSRGFFFKSLLCLILFLYLNFVQIKPAFAITSVDQCARNVACAKVVFANTGAKAVLKQSAGSVANKKFKYLFACYNSFDQYRTRQKTKVKQKFIEYDPNWSDKKNKAKIDIDFDLDSLL